ncbi:MAG: SCP2 sterol-binding domain-containing protein [Acidimicrobiaceae bacterium]|nr:SCP2 sterol-binding domain-containing protein [Acidimicrobiaceae bacterium]MYE97170.1 SCP2 sterol-binding domain-containing protein [Acidimicrobiaceae bacterium]MYH43903.1 SCP2 sterol-binding domain-containing protein [Acidimicrobiaceae bacterium]MYI54553.1 SCP2 sterol-binding domain-containing protein [Acidimicrobiaceae bacterium]MYJ43582.1 SCP2 sterol-binding domain-containing protein [Acidimicrobiaceae bacterium]
MTIERDAGDMPVFPSDEWVGWLDAALSECRVDDSVGLVLEYHASDDDAPVFCWHVRIASGRVSAAVGRAGEAHGLPVVTLASDRDTARAIAIEGESAQRAFAEGRLRFDGDPRLLLAARPAMEAIGAVLAGAA